MNAFFKFINSSVGKKLLMSLTGLFLCIFLVEHLIGNLLLLKNDGGEAFDTFAKFMGGNPLVRTMEIGLLGFILIHIVNGGRIWFMNRQSRDQKYGTYKLEDNTTLQSRMMALSASLVLLFLIIHMKSFWVPARFLGEHKLAFVVFAAFKNPGYVIFYLISLFVLGMHLRHGFQSAFQTLGWRTKKYAGLIDFIAVLFWLVVPIGFAIIPIIVYFSSGFSVALAQ